MSTVPPASPTATSASTDNPLGENLPGFNMFGEDLVIPQKNWGWFVARGVLLILLGIVSLFAPGAALFAFVMVFAAFSFVDGVFGVIAAIRGARNSKERWGSLLFSGLVGIAIGVLFVLYPMVSTWAFAIVSVGLIAAWAVLTGLLQIAAAIRLRKVIKGEFWLGLAGAVSVILGLVLVYLMINQPAITALSIAWMIGIYAIVAGVSLIALGLRLKKLPA